MVSSLSKSPSPSWPPSLSLLLFFPSFVDPVKNLLFLFHLAVYPLAGKDSGTGGFWLILLCPQAKWSKVASCCCNNCSGCVLGLVLHPLGTECWGFHGSPCGREVDQHSVKSPQLGEAKERGAVCKEVTGMQRGMAEDATSRRQLYPVHDSPAS